MLSLHMVEMVAGITIVRLTRQGPRVVVHSIWKPRYAKTPYTSPHGDMWLYDLWEITKASGNYTAISYGITQVG
jgi:hypothetical protein